MILHIDPTVDFACKMVLGNPQHPRITIHFLNAVLKPKSPIVGVQILNPIVLQAFDADKLSILDVLAVDQEGRRFNIEIQRTLERALPERLTYYAATQLIDQIGEGDGYQQLRPSIGICLLSSILWRDKSEYHTQYRLRTDDGHELTNCLEINILELPKFPLPGDNSYWTPSDPRDAWFYFFLRAGEESVESTLEAGRPGI